MIEQEMALPEIMNRNAPKPPQETTVRLLYVVCVARARDCVFDCCVVQRQFILNVVAPFYDRCLAPVLSRTYAKMLRSNVSVVCVVRLCA
jgi:hypothetical protein